MKLRGIHRLAAVTGAAVLATTMVSTTAAHAGYGDTVCGPEVELGSIVYKTCSDTLDTSGVPSIWGTQQFIEVTNRGIASTDVSVELQHYNYSTSAWVTDSTGNRTVAAGATTRYFSPNTTWSCGQGAKERTRATTSVGTGAWSQADSPAPC